MCRPFTRRDTCQGHELGVASWPPTIRDPKVFCPHPTKKNRRFYHNKKIVTSDTNDKIKVAREPVRNQEAF